MDHQPIDNRVVDAMVEASVSTTPEETKEVRLSRGVTIGFQNVPPMIFERIDKKFPDPPVPDVYDEDKGRSYPNPDHPEYKKALKDNAEAKGTALTDALLGMGTYLISVDEGLQRPEDTEWKEELEFVAGIEVPKVKVGVWLYYLKYYAIQSAEEFKAVISRGSKALGVSESEVSAAVDRYKSDEERGTDPVSAP